MNGSWDLWHRWDLVAVSAAVHLVVILGFLLASTGKGRRRLVNKPNGVLSAFIVALYVEMYGLPLTLVALQPLLPGRLLIGPYPPTTPVRVVGSLLILGGFLLVAFGWRRIHQAQAKGLLTSQGIYSVIRHPQYVGLMLLTLGQLVQWPTLGGLVLWPLMVLVYMRLARQEERECTEVTEGAYQRYAADVPAFIPGGLSRRLGHLKSRPREGG